LGSTTSQLASAFGDSLQIRDGSGSKVWVGSAIYGLPLILENFHIFQLFSLRIKKNLFGLGQKVPGSKAGRPLIYRGSTVSAGRVGAHLYFKYNLGKGPAPPNLSFAVPEPGPWPSQRSRPCPCWTPRRARRKNVAWSGKR